MSNNFKQSMTWLHTWLGLIVGWILLGVFVTGTASYYKNEITIWMKPALHNSQESTKSLTIAIEKAVNLSKKTNSFSIELPNNRSNTVSIKWYDKEKTKNKRIKKYYDASTGEEIITRKTQGGSFLYRFHYRLHGLPFNLGRYIVSIATMFMLIVIISGILIHTKIFKDIFEYRDKKKTRTWMDAHILPSVASLPFLIMIIYSSLIFSIKVIMPWAVYAAYEKPREYREKIVDNSRILTKEVQINNKSEKDIYVDTKKVLKENKIAKDKLIVIFDKVDKLWPNKISSFKISKNKITNEFEIKFFPKYSSTIFKSRAIGETLLYNLNTTKLIEKLSPVNIKNKILITNAVFGNLHMAKFSNKTIRVLFFFLGITSVIVIISGLLLWIKKRKGKYEKINNSFFRLVEKINIAMIAGIFIALAGYFIANRLISSNYPNRDELEINVFFTFWLLSFIHAFSFQAVKVWKTQLLVASLLFISIPILSAITWQYSIDGFFGKSVMLISFDIFFVLISLVFYLSYRIVKKNDLGRNNAK